MAIDVILQIFLSQKNGKKFLGTKKIQISHNNSFLLECCLVFVRGFYLSKRIK
jgi:hypothetical protein